MPYFLGKKITEIHHNCLQIWKGAQDFHILSIAKFG
jgi:hypothetical protein